MISVTILVNRALNLVQNVQVVDTEPFYIIINASQVAHQAIMETRLTINANNVMHIAQLV